MHLIRTGLLATLAAFSSLCSALDIGDTSPGLAGVTWVKGAAPTSGKVTVVEFWATWCGPCVKGIPHLTALQKQHGDKVAIVGLSDEEADTVKPFVAAQGAKMDYGVGLIPGELREKYMAGVNGIPHAFVFDAKGVAVWAGHPMTMDQPLRKIIDGTYDAKKAKQLAGLEKSLQEILQSARSPEQLTPALAKTAEILAVDPTNHMGIDLRLKLASHLKKTEIIRSTLDGIPLDQLDAESASELAVSRVGDDDLAQRHLDLALKFATHARKLAPKNVDVLLASATVFAAIGRLDDAIAAMQAAVAAEPASDKAKDALAYYQGAKDLGAKLAK